MLIIRIKDIPAVDGLTHISTTWQIATDSEFTTVLEEVTSSVELTVHYSELTVPIDVIYYVRAMRHFNDSNADYWSEVKHIIDNENEYSTMLLTNDLRIEIPTIAVSDSIYNNEEDSFVISTSEFRCKDDAHAYTHWIIKDNDGEVLYSKLYDGVDLTSKSVDKGTSIVNKTDIVIHAIHGTESGIESSVGYLNLTFSDFNYKITSDLTKVRPFKDYLLTFAKVDTTLPLRINKVVVINSDSETIVNKLTFSESITSGTIPWNILTNNSTFYLDVYGYDLNNTFRVSRRTLTTRDNIVTDITNVNYPYEPTLTKIEIDGISDLSNFLHLRELPNGFIPIVKNGEANVSLYTYDNTTKIFTDSGEVMNGVSLIGTDNNSTYIKFLDNDMVLIDTLSIDDYPIFMLYKYSRANNTYSLVSGNIRNDEINPMGYNNNIFQYDNDSFIYIPYGTATIKKYDIVNNVILTLNEIPDEDSAFTGTIIPIGKNELLLYGGSNYASKVYNMETNEFTNVTSVVPDIFLNTELKNVMLANGDTIVYKLGSNDVDAGHSIVYFDYSTRKIVTNTFAFTLNLFPNVSISKMNGETLLVCPGATGESGNITKSTAYIAV